MRIFDGSFPSILARAVQKSSEKGTNSPSVPMIAFSSDNERKRDAKRKRADRANERDVEIRKCANRARRNRALADVYSFLDLYFGHRFYNPLTQMHRDMVQAILYRATHGGDQAIAAPRGEGKTTIAECVIIFCVLKGLLKFPLIVAATGPDATRILDNIKHEFETNELLAADFPEVCDPIIALEGGTARQNMQTVDGQRTRLKWSNDFIVFPEVPPKYKSPCSGTVLMTRGLDAAIRGIRHHGQRPDFVLIDDPETRESAASEHQIKTREDTLDRDIAGLGGQGRKIARVALCTVQNRHCLAFRLTDPPAKPSWAGRRYKLLENWPSNKGLWEQYLTQRQSGMAAGDAEANQATKFYLDSKDAMDEGAIVTNPNRFVRETEHSTLQHCYNFIADKGMDAFLTECQNDPPDEAEGDTNQITSAIVAKRLSGLDYRELPHGCEKIVSFIDLGEQFCNWTDSAWRGQCIGSVLDHGTIDVKAGPVNPITKLRDPQTLELGIMAALHEWRNELLAKYRDHEGQPVGIDLALIDSGSGIHTKTVYKFCREVGRPFFPSKGSGENFRIPKDKVDSGDRWALVRQPGGILLYEFDATFWKQFCHQRFLTPRLDEKEQLRPGSLSLFVCPEQEQFLKDRREYTHQIVGEVWGVKRLGAKPGWIARGKNHYLDATAGNCLAANIVGIRLVADIKRPTKQMSLAEMAAVAKR
jgi:hypothetical protein